MKPGGIKRIWVVWLPIGLVLSGSYFYKELIRPDVPGVDLSLAEQPVKELIISRQKQAEESPDSHEAWGQLAMAYHVHGFRIQAVTCYEQAVKLKPDYFNWPYFLAILLYDEMGSTRALDWYRSIQALKPEYQPALLRFAGTLLNTGDAGAAAEMYSRVLKVNPNSQFALAGMTRAELAQDKLYPAANYAQKLTRLNPQSQEGHALMAQILRRSNKPEDAEKHQALSDSLTPLGYIPDSLYAELSETGVSSEWHSMRGNQLAERSRWTRAAAEYLAQVKAQPSTEGYTNLGTALFQMHLGNVPYDNDIIRGSIREFTRGVESYPKNAMLKLSLGMSLCATGKFTQGMEYFKRALLLEPDFLLAYQNLGKNQWHTGEKQKAIATFRKGLKKFRQDTYIKESLVWLLSTNIDPKLREPPTAVTLALELCRKSHYRDPNHLDLLGTAYAANGQFTQAIKTAKSALLLASRAGSKKFAEDIQKRLKMFESKKVYTE